jgi:hypothetical protein
VNLISVPVIETWPAVWQLVACCLTTCPIIQIHFKGQCKNVFEYEHMIRVSSVLAVLSSLY